MKIVVDEIDISECPFYYMGKCRCGVYEGSCDFEPENDQGGMCTLYFNRQDQGW